MTDWYFSYDGSQIGPLSTTEAMQKVFENPNGYAWKEGFIEWIPIPQAIKEILIKPVKRNIRNLSEALEALERIDCDTENIKNESDALLLIEYKKYLLKVRNELSERNLSKAKHKLSEVCYIDIEKMTSQNNEKDLSKLFGNLIKSVIEVSNNDLIHFLLERIYPHLKSNGLDVYYKELLHLKLEILNHSARLEEEGNLILKPLNEIDPEVNVFGRMFIGMKIFKIWGEYNEKILPIYIQNIALSIELFEALNKIFSMIDRDMIERENLKRKYSELLKEHERLKRKLESIDQVNSDPFVNGLEKELKKRLNDLKNI